MEVTWSYTHKKNNWLLGFLILVNRYWLISFTAHLRLVSNSSSNHIWFRIMVGITSKTQYIYNQRKFKFMHFKFLCYIFMLRDSLTYVVRGKKLYHQLLLNDVFIVRSDNVSTLILGIDFTHKWKNQTL